MDRYFVEIDTEKYENFGEVYITAPPIQWSILCEREFAKVPRGGFEIHRRESLCSFVKAIGGQRGVVGEFLIRRKDSQNKILATNREIAAITGISLGATNALLQQLRNSDCIRCRSGSLMVNPGVAHRGDRRREAFLLNLYENFENKT